MSDQDKEQAESPVGKDIWADEQDAIKEIKEFKQPLDLAKMIDGARVFLMGSNHSDASPLEFIDWSTTDFKNSGITHFALEKEDSCQPVLDRFNSGQEVSDEELNTIFSEKSKKANKGDQWSHYGPDILRRLKAKGIIVFAADQISPQEKPAAPDWDNIPTDEESLAEFGKALDKYQAELNAYIHKFFLEPEAAETREEYISGKFLEILNQDPKNKIAGLFGSLHANKLQRINRDVPTLSERLQSKDILIRNALFMGSFDVIHQDRDTQRFNNLVEKAGLAEEEFMLDMARYNNPKNKSVPWGPGSADWLIHRIQS